MDNEQLRYPLGRFDLLKPIQHDDLAANIRQIGEFPARLTALVQKLGEARLATAYRPGGWTAAQVVHHLADSHCNALIRFKLALTEDNPTIRPYAEDRWAQLPDSLLTPVAVSLQLLAALHARWEVLLKSMPEADFDRTYLHPEGQRIYPLRQVVALYVWHGNHHYAHIESVLGQA